MAIFFYDRADVLIGGQSYLGDGRITSVSVTPTYNNSVIQGFSRTGEGTGNLIGNSTYIFSWTELLTSLAEYVAWKQFCIANPNIQFIIQPLNIVKGTPNAAPFIFSGVQPTGAPIDIPSQGQEAKRTCSFSAVSCINL